MRSRIFTCTIHIDMWRGNVSRRLKDVMYVSRDVLYTE